MENTYSIAVANKFLLALDEDEDPLEVLKVKEQEKEAKRKEKLSEKENKSKQPDQPAKPPATKVPKNRIIKDPQQQQPSKIQQEPKKDQEKKPTTRPVGDRNVKFSGESREERNNRRNREDGDRPPRAQGDQRRGPPGEGRDRENRDYRGNSGDAPRGDYAERRERGGGARGAGGGRGYGGPRGGRGGRGGFDNRGKRDLDRQSRSDKTGVKPVDKREGGGSHNWGTHRDEIEEQMIQETQDWNVDKAEGEAPQAPTEVKEAGETPADTATEEKPNAEDESRELTLDEWKALQGNRAKPQYNLRKAGEGEDLTRWKKMYALEKKKEGVEEEEEEEEEYDAAAEYPQRVGRQKHVLDIEFHFADSRRGAGGRGSRGGRGGRGDRANGRGFGGRGGAGGGGGGPNRDSGERTGDRDRERDRDIRVVPAPQPEQRSPRGRQNAPKVDDEHDFPSLG